MSDKKMTSAFAERIEGYLRFKKDSGRTGGSREWYMCDFDRYCAENGLTAFDRETVEGWVKSREADHPSEYRSWISYIRDLGRYLQMMGDPDAYVLSDSFRSKTVPPDPYLFTEEELDAFFETAAALRWSGSWQWTAGSFFGLMHSCGLRTCEARRLRPCDVDLVSRRIDIVWSKGHRSRRLAISDEVASMLEECDFLTSAEHGAERPTFFANAAGRPISPCSVGNSFGRIWDAADLPPRWRDKRPRPYDLRHHFAYANVERWAAEGLDVNAMAPYLAEYMGHSSFDTTFYYIHTSPSFMADYAGIVRETDARILPEVGFDD